ncbi:MAG: IclR family transcriptional regulator [Pseudomonadota bacterium]
MRERQNTLYVGSLAKGLRLLHAFDAQHIEMSLGELAERTGLDKSATQRLANTLYVEGMLDKDPVTRRFRPSRAWLKLAYAYYWSDPLVALAMPKMIELSRKFDLTIALAEMMGDHIIYVSRFPSRSSPFSSTLPGRHLPALSCSAGRAMLSTWPADQREDAIRTWTVGAFTPETVQDRDQIRAEIEGAAKLGYATTQDQMILNRSGIAAAIKGQDGVAYSSIQCSVSSHHWSWDRIHAEILPHLLEVAASIEPRSRGN